MEPLMSKGGDMWKLLALELKYSKAAYLFCWGAALGIALVLYLAVNTFSYIMVMGGSVPCIVLFLVWAGAKEDEEKRIRLLTLFPVSVREIAVSQILSFFLFLAGMIIIWSVSSVLSPGVYVPGALLSIACFSGSIITWAFLIWIFSDMKQGFNMAAGIIFIVSAALLIAAIIMVGTRMGVKALYWFSLSPGREKTVYEALSMILLSCILVFIQYNVFIRRRSYLK